MGLYHSVSSPQIEGLRRPHTMAAPQHRAAPRMEELWPWQRDTSSASLLAVLDKAAAIVDSFDRVRRFADADADESEIGNAEFVSNCHDEGA